MILQIDKSKAKEMLKNQNNIVVLDVRTKEEYNIWHIKNSILIPVDILEKKIQKYVPNKNTIIIIYCSVGIRSENGAYILDKIGYKKIYNLGGISEF